MSLSTKHKRPIGGIRDTSILPEWAIGPFEVDEEPVLEPTTGWEAGRIFNISIIESRGGTLFALYRGTPSVRTDLDSQIGVAWSNDGGETFHRYEDNPVIEVTEAYEELGCEDPKVYLYNGTYYMFYNPAWKEGGQVCCNICLATSENLIEWEKHGKIVPESLLDGWAKGAVIPRDPRGRPVKIDGEFLMYVGELKDDRQLIGRSDDLRNWTFEEETFISPRPEQGVEAIHEPASMITNIPGREDDMILTTNYKASESFKECLHVTNPVGTEYPPSGQVLYSKDEPFTPKGFAPEPAGSWGGIIEYEGEWVVPEQETARFARAPLE